MTMVSKYRLRPELWERIFNLFEESILGINDKKLLDGFLEDFLSPTEKIMLGKRFAIAVLLSKGVNYSEIENTLHVTSTTIAKVNIFVKYKGKGLNMIMNKLLKKEAGKLLWEEIQSIFDIPTKGLPISEYYKKVTNRKKNIERLQNSI